MLEALLDFAQCVRGTLLVGYVGMHAHPLPDRPVRFENRDRSDQHVPVLPVRPPEPMLHRVLALGRHGSRPRPGTLLAIVRVDNVQPSPPPVLVKGLTGESGPPRLMRIEFA